MLLCNFRRSCENVTVVHLVAIALFLDLFLRFLPLCRISLVKVACISTSVDVYNFVKVQVKMAEQPVRKAGPGPAGRCVSSSLILCFGVFFLCFCSCIFFSFLIFCCISQSRSYPLNWQKLIGTGLSVKVCIRVSLPELFNLKGSVSLWLMWTTIIKSGTQPWF